MKRTFAQRSIDGFTLVELLVVIAIIVVLASLAFPVFSSIQERARITQDLSNLRQLGIATQTYLNDHDNIIFPETVWMTDLHPKYLPSWKIFQSPFDHRTFSEDDTTAPISYGLNANAINLSTDKIQKPTSFILIATAQNSSAKVDFSGVPSAKVTVLRASSAPGGTATGGTATKRSQINALFADLHCETLSWDTFKQAATGPADDPSRFRWEP